MRGFTLNRTFNKKERVKSIPLVDQVHHNLYHYILLFRLAFGNHQSESDEGIICQALGAIRVIIPLLLRNHKNNVAAMRLLPSLNEWFLVTRYSNMAAFSSTLG